MQLLYAADLLTILTDNLKSPNPTQKPRSQPDSSYTPHLVPRPGCLLGAPVFPTITLETYSGSSLFDLTYPINTCNTRLPL